MIASLVWHPATNWVDSVDPAADPRARKGGTIRFNAAQPPKSFNAYVDGNAYTRMMFDLMYENLLAVDGETLEFAPCLARRWAVSEDGNEFVFVLDERARWSDGHPVTAEDVKWTFDIVMAPSSDTGPWKSMMGVFESPEVVDVQTISFRKKGGTPKDWRDLLHCGLFYVLPKHALEGRDFNAVDFSDVPVSGAYRIARVAEQVETVYARVATWWRRDFPGCRGVCNFDRIVMRYFTDNENAFEALKKRAIDVYPVYTARILNEEARGEKFDRNWILRRGVRNHNPIGFQGFAMNCRRKPFDDVRVRKAMALLIDRETMNRTMMSNAYFLLDSYFPDLYGAANPCANEHFGYDVERAKRLLAEAGYADGFEFSFLSRSGGEDKFLSLFNHALEACNVRMKIVRKDFAGWMRDMDSFAFDMTWAAWGASVFRNLETMWSSAEADRKGSNNIVGFRNAEVDGIIAAEKTMETMAERLDAYRRVDALIAKEVPYALLWQTDRTRLLYWNKFGMPRTVLSKHSDEQAILSYWWYDEDKARELEEARKSRSCLPDVPFDVDFDEVRGLGVRSAAGKGGPESP